MATEVIHQDVTDINGDCDISESKTTLAENGSVISGQVSIKHPDEISNSKKRGNHAHHHRRKPSKKKRKWKPYSKMTWEEKKAAEERERIRADRIRGEMMDRGRPVAPYNTTQFIMAEHDPYEEDSVLDSGSSRGNEDTNKVAGNNDSNSCGTSSNQSRYVDSPANMDDLIEAEYTDSPHMAPEFISQDFSEAYERVQEESLATMSRNDLVTEHLSLERTLCYLQEKLADEKNINNSYSVKVQNIEEELERLRKDNRRLVHENLTLRYGEEVANQECIENGTFQTSDFEYEAPNSENGDLSYYECSDTPGDEDHVYETQMNGAEDEAVGESRTETYEDDMSGAEGNSLVDSSTDSKSPGNCEEKQPKMQQQMDVSGEVSDDVTELISGKAVVDETVDKP